MIKNYYIEEGQGRPLILLHGNNSSSDYFSCQFDDFSKHFHIYALDTRGHGKTPRGNEDFTLVQFADDLNIFMQEHGIEKANILGFSDGGNIAMIFAIKYPEKVDKLILNGANFEPQGLKWYFNVIINIMYGITEKTKGKNKKHKAKNELLSLMINEPDLTEKELSSIKAKTLVVAGTRDLIKASHTKRIASLIPDSKLLFIRGNHAVSRMNPKAFNRAVLDFLLEK